MKKLIVFVVIWIATLTQGCAVYPAGGSVAYGYGYPAYGYRPYSNFGWGGGYGRNYGWRRPGWNGHYHGHGWNGPRGYGGWGGRGYGGWGGPRGYGGWGGRYGWR